MPLPLLTAHSALFTSSSSAPPSSPASGPATGPFNGLHAKSKFLAICLAISSSAYAQEPQWLIQPTFEEALPFTKNGLAGVRHKGKWGYINHTGKEVIKNEWDLATSFSEGRALIKNESKWGVIDEKGTQIIQPCFFAASFFEDGIAFVVDESHFGTIDVTGKWKIRLPHALGDINPQSDFPAGRNTHIVRLKTGKGYVHAEALDFSIAMSDEGKPLHEGFPIRFPRDKYGHTGVKAYDNGITVRHGNRLIVGTVGDIVFDSNAPSVQQDFPDGAFECRGYSDGIATIWVTHRKTTFLAYYISATGKVIRKFDGYNPGFGPVETFNSGLAPFSEQTKKLVGFIDKSGKVVIEPKWKSVTSFNASGFAMVQNNGILETIDSKGQVVAKLENLTPGQLKLSDPHGKFFLTAGTTAHTLDKLINEKGEEVFPGHHDCTPVGTTGYFVAKGKRGEFSIFKGEREIIAQFRGTRLDLHGGSHFRGLVEALAGDRPYPHRSDAGVGFVQLPKLKSN